MGNRTSVVATVDDLQLTNGQLQVFYGMQYINFMNSDYGYYYGPNTTKPLDEQIYDEETGMTWQQFFLDTALSTWRRYALLAKEAKEVGFTLPSDMQKLLDSTEANLQETLATTKYETVDEMLQADFGTGCTLEDYLYYQDLYYYSNAYFSSMIDAFEISQDEIEAYFTEHEAELKANSITKTVQASKTLISQNIGRVLTVVECYRELPKKNKEVLVQIFYNKEKAMASAKRTIKEQLVKEGLAKEGEELHQRLDKILGY